MWCSPASPFRPTPLSVSINAQGQVNATVAGNATPQTVGQLELTRFPNEAGLNAVGDNLFLETAASGAPQAGVPGSPGYGTIQQGFLETSNVNSVDEITALITAQRAYEMNSKVDHRGRPDAAADLAAWEALSHDPQTSLVLCCSPAAPLRRCPALRRRRRAHRRAGARYRPRRSDRRFRSHLSARCPAPP